MAFDKEFQDALMRDAQVLRDMGADCPDPIFFDTGEDDGWCVECGDEFHYDDVGGYNPPCSCGAHCRSCHEAVEGNRDPDDDYERDEESYPDDEDRPR